MITGLFIILAMVFILPFVVKLIENNLEYFLFFMGLAAVIVSGIFSKELFTAILTNPLLYYITAAVLIAGLLFKFSVNDLEKTVNGILDHIPFKVFVMLVIIVLGLLSSLVTAIIASLILVEIINILPIKQKEKIKFTVAACFSIGLGAALTPVGEPLATIVISRLHADFWYIVANLGMYIIPGIIILGIFGGYFVKYDKVKTISDLKNVLKEKREEKLSEVFIRAFKIFVFIFALDMLGSGFKPLIDTYVIQLSSKLLFWINMVSAILDNATLAAAEISPSMSVIQIKAILMGLLISGGMLIPGNIPNIVSAGKLKIKSKEWAAIGVPMGLVIMFVYFAIIFIL